jgi:hypothetical protein
MEKREFYTLEDLKEFFVSMILIQKLLIIVRKMIALW